MDSKGPSSSTSSSRKWKYDVFLSFRGEDTRKSFTDHLYTTLKQKGIFTFRDDEKLERGKPIKPKLLEAIEESLYAIVILSKNYASSTWCLDELVKIMECKNKIGLIVYPIFYDVDPSEVRKQTGTYAQAFVKHERENIDKVHIWRAALTEVANLSGLSLHDRYESEFIRDIVEFISYKLRYPLLRDIKGLVGIDSQVEDLMSLLSIGSNDVRIIGIWGMGGIGKTTLARVVYDMIFSEFEGDCFITNVRSKSEKYGLLPLQQKLISDILMEKSVDIYIRDDYDGVRIIKNSLSHKKILLVLDDVNHFSQLEKLAGESDWFGPGSRVIITTREGRLLKMHNVCGIYEPQGLNDIEALRLFSLKAFKIDNPPEDYLKLSTYFVNYAKGLPLAIDVLGSFLHGRSKEEWESASYKLKEYPEKEINETLEISFNGLQDIEKEIFLHIACFFNMKDKDYIVEILDCLGLYPTFGLDVLIEKSLLKDYENKYWMHDLLQIMGQDIVRRDYPQEPEKWSKLWLHKDIRNLFMKNTEMEAIEGLVLECGELHKSEMAYWNLEAFPNMPNLKLLIIHDVQLLHGPKHLSNKLRILDWSMYPSKSLPSNFQPYELVELQLLHSKIEQLWKGTKEICKHSIILYPFGSFNIVIPGSEIPKWFSHQSVGNRVNEQVTHPNKNVNIQVPSRSSNMWIGIAVCAVLSCPNFYLSDILRCCILINKHKGSKFSVGINPRWVKIKSHHLWLSYIPSQMFNEKVRAVLSQIDENGIIQIEVRFQWDSNYFPEVNKCGFRMVYEQDIEDIREMISAQSSNSTCITPYEGLNIHHDFHNSTEGIKMKRSRDEYEGAGASGEGNSNDVSHSKRIER